MTMALYRASKQQAGLAFSSQPVYVPGVPSAFQQPPIGSSERAASQQLPVYVHNHDLGEVPGYEGYSITPERKIVRPDRVFAQIEESPVLACGPRVRLSRAESSPAHLRDHNGGIPRFNPDLTPTRRSTDDGRNTGNLSNEGYNLANEFPQYHRRQHTTIRAGSSNANDGRYRQHQREFYNIHGNQSRELEEIEEAKQI